MRLRQLYRQGKLSEERTARLNDIGFVWIEHNPVSWEEMYQQLKNYEAEVRLRFVCSFFLINSIFLSMTSRTVTAMFPR
jgi:hypothetical protein